MEKGQEKVKKEKTFKREIAAVLLGVLFYVIYTGNVEMVNAIIWPFVLFVGGAFGIAAFDQLRKGPPF